MPSTCKSTCAQAHTHTNHKRPPCRTNKPTTKPRPSDYLSFKATSTESTTFVIFCYVCCVLCEFLHVWIPSPRFSYFWSIQSWFLSRTFTEVVLALCLLFTALRNAAALSLRRPLQSWSSKPLLWSDCGILHMYRNNTWYLINMYNYCVSVN